MNRRAIKSRLGDWLAASGLHRTLLGDRGVVVAFHRVSDLYRDPLTCSVEMFERFCEFFRRHFTVVPLSETVRRLERGEPLAGTLAVSFDDGYRDNFEFAAPVLSSLGLPATFFVVSDFLGTSTIAPWDRALTPAPAWMTWNEARQLHDAGFTIGAHTRTHANLGEVFGARAEWEISGSKDEIEARLGTAVELFAYPFGRTEHLSEGNRELVRRAGFRCCASCFGGSNARGADSFRVRRVPISTWFVSPGQFACEVALRRA